MASTTPRLAVHPRIELNTDEEAAQFRMRIIGHQRAHAVDADMFELIRAVHNGAPLSDDARTTKRLSWLINHEYLLESDSNEYRTLIGTAQQWEENAWAAAGRYHFETFGYPFERYARGRSPVDTARMDSYVENEPDLDRGKSYATQTLNRIALTPPTEISLLTPANFQDEPVNQIDDAAKIDDVLSLLGLPVRRDPMPWAHSRKVLRKTSPSGGSRHPTEIYFINRSIDDLAVGIYHINGDEGVADLIDEGTSRSNDIICASGGSIDTAGALVFASRFSRNRFRYREPRTFRTVHMDVGHLMTTAEYLLEAIGLRPDGRSHIDAEVIGRVLNFNPLIEHPIGAVLIESAYETVTTPKGTP